MKWIRRVKKPSLDIFQAIEMFEREERGAGARQNPAAPPIPSAPSWNTINQPWKCSKCTYMNTSIEHQNICEMCNNDRKNDGMESIRGGVEGLGIEARERGRTAPSTPSPARQVQFAGKYKRTNCKTYQEFLDTPSPTIFSSNIEVTDLGGGKWRCFYSWK